MNSVSILTHNYLTSSYNYNLSCDIIEYRYNRTTMYITIMKKIDDFNKILTYNINIVLE